MELTWLLLRPMQLDEQLERLRSSAERFSQQGESLTAILPIELDEARLYLCSYCSYDSAGARAWLVLDAEGHPVIERERIRSTVSVAALCELAEESAGGGDLSELRARLVELRLLEAPDGIEEAELAAAELAATLNQPPRVASLDYLDRIGIAARRLEQALGEVGGSPFAAAMQLGSAVADGLTREVELYYKLPLE